ncbi:uncharacterized protein CLUP02_13413 [Colletotrichum lupini]|uniref:Uncharacterized protein n=1 Tax=Colletotrichum lupini TaxID=145971 RepID=A0A9Q8WM46_9PEZI|nr:uncharacterized protein CLUP02_13413 [Colletotrichum lupini]UQC87892.1 hypothetical protein CLUP02_13413 [Colletotrichum lupini]
MTTSQTTPQATGSILLKGGTLLFHNERDDVTPLKNTDILVQGNRIAKIGKAIALPAGAQLVDCSGKIISPGFVDTHHHLWQTQLKGCHADQSIFDYVPSATQALSATIASGIRSIFAYSQAPYFTKWDSKTCELSMDIMPDSSMAHIFELAKAQPYGNGRVQIGFGFDYWFLPKEAIVGIFNGLRHAGIKLFTSHYAKNPTFGLDASEKAKLAETQVAVSSTPDTEAQMGFGWPLAFSSGINYTIGVDCHTNNTSSILSLARSALQMARQREAIAETNGSDGAPQKLNLQPAGSTQDAFNAATIRGARAVLLGDEIGSLKEGKLADLVLFDAAGSVTMSCVADSDPLTAVVRHSDIRDIEAVLIDGVWRKQGGKVCPVTVAETGSTLQWAEIRDKLLESQREIQQRQKNLNMEKAKEALVAISHLAGRKSEAAQRPRESRNLFPTRTKMAVSENNATKTVALAGASGNLGLRILESLLDAEFDVTVLIRRESTPIDYPVKARVVEVDYDSPESLKNALGGTDAVVSAVGKQNGLQSQFKLIDAAIAAGVKRFIPSEFGADLQNPKIRAFPTYRTKVEVEDYLEKEVRDTGLTYTYVYNSVLFDEGLSLGAFANFSTRTVNIFDGGDTTFSATRIKTVAQAVAAILKNLDATKNKAVRIRDLAMTPKQLLETLKALDQDHAWKAVAVNTESLVKNAEHELASGKFSPKAFAAFALRATFAPEHAQDYSRDNELLGIIHMTKEDIQGVLAARLC